MARDISRKRSNLGSGDIKRAPTANEQNLQVVIDTIYRELNELKNATSSTSKLSASTPTEGKDGDIRLYAERATDGTVGYFVQGKFGDSWASGRLQLDTIAPKSLKSDGTTTVVPSYGTSGEGYITSAGVTYEALDTNLDVGELSGQVAKGNHVHDHNSDSILNTGTNTHAQIDSHISDLSIHREPNDSAGNMALVRNNTPHPGSQDLWARSDHVHQLDQSVTYEFTALQKFNVSSGNAMEVTGDVTITGNLTVDFVEADTGDTTIGSDLSVGEDVVLNNGTNLNGNVNNVNTNTIHGSTLSHNKVQIRHQTTSGNPQLSLEHSSSVKTELYTNSTGQFYISPDTDIVLNPTNGNILPKGNMEIDLGTDTRKFRSLYAGELVVDNIIAQNVMATIGGKIMVAPTNVVMVDISSTDTSITLKYNDPNFQDAFLFLQKADVSLPDEDNNVDGIVQFEVIRTSNASPTSTDVNGETCYTYTITTRNVDGSGANAWVENDAIVCLYKPGSGGNKGYIELTSSGTVLNSTGPRITAYAASDTDTVWNAAKPVFSIGRIGGYGGVPSNDDTAGLVIGDNLTSGPSDSTNPFKGMVAQRTGLKLFNTPIKMYDGNNLNVLIDRDSNDRNVFAIGASIDESTLAGADLKFAYDNTPGVETYVLTIDGNIDLSENVDFTINESDIMSAIDHFLPSTDMGNVSQRGLYLTPGWLGFWEYDASNPGAAYWPVKLGATASGTSGDPFFEIKNHPTLPTEFIRYTTDNGLEIQGKINVQGKFPTIRYSNFDTNTQINSSGDTFVVAEYISHANDENVYIAMRCRDAENGAALYWYNSWNTSESGEPSPDVNGGVFLGNLHQGFVENNTNSFETWLTFTVPVASLGNSGSNYGLIQTKSLSADGIQLLDIIVYNSTEEYLNLNELKANITASGAETTADNAIPGNVDYTLTNDIILGNGSIQIGNTVNSAVFSAGTTDFDTDNSTPGFRLGNDEGAYKFLIKNNQDNDSANQQYIKIDTSLSTQNAIEIKGALHADRLADVTPKIADAGGTYRNLSIIKHHYDGYFDVESNSGPQDMTSSSCVVEGVRNGAIVTVHISATGTGSPNDRSFWVNPRLVYAKSGTGFPTYIPDNITGKFRLGGGWKEVDWIPFADAQITSDGDESTSPPFWKVHNTYFQSTTGYTQGGSSPWPYNGDALVIEIDPDENDIGITPDNDFIGERFGSSLTALQFGIWDTSNPYSNAIKAANMLWVGTHIGWNGSKAKIALLPTTGDNYGGSGTSAVGSIFVDNNPYGPESYQVRTGTDMQLQQFDNDLLQLGYANSTEFHNYGNNIDEHLGGVGMTIAFDHMAYMPSWIGAVRAKLYPVAFIGDPGSNLPDAMYYFYGGANKHQYDAYSSNPASCPCPFTRSLIYARENNEDTNLKIGVEPISFYVADDYYKTFNHTYTFKVDIPDLHTGTNAGKININFGTGTPWSAWPTYGEERNILDVTFNVTVDNGG